MPFRTLIGAASIGTMLWGFLGLLVVKISGANPIVLRWPLLQVSFVLLTAGAIGMIVVLMLIDRHDHPVR